MKFTTVFAVLATLATAVSATLSDFNTNAKRLANGMALLPPARRGTATHSGHGHKPSSVNQSCGNNAKLQCCNQVTKANSSVQSLIEELLGLVLSPDVTVGLTCDSLTVIGLSRGECTRQVACCENNSFGGVLAIGCSNMNL